MLGKGRIRYRISQHVIISEELMARMLRIVAFCCVLALTAVFVATPVLADPPPGKGWKKDDYKGNKKHKDWRHDERRDHRRYDGDRHGDRRYDGDRRDDRRYDGDRHWRDDHRRGDRFDNDRHDGRDHRRDGDPRKRRDYRRDDNRHERPRNAT